MKATVYLQKAKQGAVRRGHPWIFPKAIARQAGNVVTGELVDYTGEAAPFEKALSENITRLMSQPELLKKYGNAGRVRAMKEFGWDAVAAATVALYKRVIA